MFHFDFGLDRFKKMKQKQKNKQTNKQTIKQTKTKTGGNSKNFFQF